MDSHDNARGIPNPSKKFNENWRQLSLLTGNERYPLHSQLVGLRSRSPVRELRIDRDNGRECFHDRVAVKMSIGQGEECGL